MATMKKEKKRSALQKMAIQGGIGAVSPLVASAILGMPYYPGMSLSGGIDNAAAQGLGEAIYGDSPTDGSFGTEFKKGATGGAITGGVKGVMGAGAMPGGANLVRFLMSRGMGKRAAITAALGAGGLAGAGINALDKGLSSGLLFGMGD